MITKGQSTNKVGAGKSIINRHERSYKRGTLMFIEGESSSEMFIIKSGLVRILKQEGQNTVELAQLGVGSVLGELSLLDHQPRGATAQVLEDTLVTVIDEELFTRTLKSIPSWLESMIQLVVKRLRDTMKKTGEDIVRKSIGGVIQVLLLMREAVKYPERIVYVHDLREQVLAVTGLGALELENVLLHCILKELLLLKKDSSGREYIVIKECPALQLYMQYLRMHQRGGVLIGESLGESAVALAGDLLATAEKNGTVISPKLVRVSEQQLELELDRSGKGRFVNRDALEELERLKLVACSEDTTPTTHGHHTRKVMMFNAELLENVLLLKKWLPVFSEEIAF